MLCDCFDYFGPGKPFIVSMRIGNYKAIVFNYQSSKCVNIVLDEMQLN